MRLRLRTTVVLAAAGHVLAAGALLVVRPPAAATAATFMDEPIDVGVEAPAATAPAIAEAAGTSPTTRGGSRATAVRTPVGEHGASRAGSDVVATDVPAASWSFEPVQNAPIDLGLGSTGRRLEPGPPSRAVAPRSAVERSLHDALSARDLGLGLGRASALVAAAREAASSPGAPDVGTTTFLVECDARGAIRVALADDRAWAGVGVALIRAMGGKTVRVRDGAHGLRAHVRVVAERAAPSGGGGSTSLGAVPDDVPGGDKACDGTGWTRRCVAGMPLGLTSAQHDSANVGARASRVVRVQVVDESDI